MVQGSENGEGFDAVFQRGIVSGLVRLASLLLVTGKCVGLTVVEELVCVSCILLPHCRFERRGRALSFVGTSIRTDCTSTFVGLSEILAVRLDLRL